MIVFSVDISWRLNHINLGETGQVDYSKGCDIPCSIFPFILSKHYICFYVIFNCKTKKLNFQHIKMHISKNKRF